MKKLVSLFLSIIMICSLSVSTFAAPVRGFRDVPNNHWAYSAIMEMTEIGLFAGTTTPDAQGIGTFSPNDVMTRAQFITVISRALFGSAIREPIEGEYWYTPNWKSLVEYDIIKESDFGGINELNKPISREEMAYIILNTLALVEYIPENTISKSDIPDSYAIENRYIDKVLSCYSMGIICGVDSQGTFSPKGAVNRAQGVTILYRMINPEARIGYVPTPPKPIIDVKDNLATVSQSAFEDYNDKTVTGTTVRAALQNFTGKAIAILINTNATKEGVTPYKDHPTIQYLRASDMSSSTNTGSILVQTTGSKPLNTRSQYGEFYINYNALFEFTPYSRLYFKDGTYVAVDVPFAVNNQGKLAFDYFDKGLTNEGNSEYINASSKFSANLIKDETDTVIGIVFTEISK